MILNYLSQTQIKKHIYSSWYLKVNKKIKPIKFQYSKLLKYKELLKSTKLYIPNLKKM